ncbi:Tll0287-like domain-containing protein [Sulfurivermis fontis]|uniref:Tll0287-like domain-containing protein n=1 Tax=Sulfurivermis fontis TaxID=1972068 RepID=UPI000FD773DD|nr:DUF3365 domain-containing protein [Sulfurivermis fontis]
MKRIIATALLCAIPLGQVLADNHGNQARVENSKAVVKEFFGKLKGELEAAMKQGGPINAIEVCNRVAPGIAKELSDKHGMDVARTSLKTRNPDNAPDAWETAVLKKFEERKAAGENPDSIAFGEVVETDGKKEFRFMKAIIMPPEDKMPCLKCHGSNIDPAIAAKLDALYPKDMARGYKAGDVRGAFTLRQPM